jgi:AraC family transcriptional regulator
MGTVAINPGASRLGEVNAIFNGRNHEYYVHDYPGPLSIKSMLRGDAVWETQQGRFQVNAQSFVVLNHREPYSMTIDSRDCQGDVPETFCAFFKTGFVEDAWGSLTLSAAALLDDPFRECAPVGFFERLRPKNGAIAARLRRMHAELAVATDGESLEPHFTALAYELLGLQSELAREMARVPVVRASTREELFRRLTLARSLIDASLDRPLRLDGIARAACLSPFHLHRLFARAFGETPHAYTTRRRLERARRLLAETEMPVTLACLECGFQSLGSFSALFRKRFGLSPSRFRAGFSAPARAAGESG